MKTITLGKTGIEASCNGLGDMALSDGLLKKRSIRKHLDKTKKLDLFPDIIYESMLAPKPGNEKPWKFIMMQNHHILQKIQVYIMLNPYYDVPKSSGE